MARRESQPDWGYRDSPDRQANRVIGQPVSAPAHSPETAAWVTSDSLDGKECRGLRPQIFQAIELPLIIREDVNQYVPEVEHDPAAGGPALDPLRTKAGIGHALGDGAIDGAQLTLIGASCNHEVIGERRKLVDVEDDRIA